MLHSVQSLPRTPWTKGLQSQAHKACAVQPSALAAGASYSSRTIHDGGTEQNQTSLAFKLAYPHLRCLHLSETPITQMRTSLPNRQKYRLPLHWASAGHIVQHSIAGTGEDFYYSIWQEEEGFPRLEEPEHTDHYMYAYMFNVPCAYRHSGHVRDKVLVFRSQNNFYATSKTIGAGIFWLYAGYEMDGCGGGDYHVSQGYGLVWNKAVITNWTLVAQRKYGSDWAVL